MKQISILFFTIALLACSNAENKLSEKQETFKPTPVKNDTAEAIPKTEEINAPHPEALKTSKKEVNQLPQSDKKPVHTASVKDEIIPLEDIEKVETPKVETPVEEEAPKADASLAYSKILSTYVSSSGKVNYAGIKKNSQLLDQAIQYYQENTPKSTWSSNQKLAFWINAYNLFTIKLIIDNYPVSSIKTIAAGKPWDKKFIQLDGKTLSLNDIENGIIRKDFHEPRIHFAVNCASMSCPKLLNQEYSSSNLNSLLEKQAKRYINDSNENTYTANSAQISSIFDWYKDDFKGGVIPFLNKYLASPLPANAKITYQDYNWNLNN